MATRTAAPRYAKALLDVATAQSDPATIERDLAGFSHLMSTHAELRQVLTAPSVSATAKQSIVGEVAERLAMAQPTRQLLTLLATRDRLGMADELLDHYRHGLRERQRRLRADVVSARPLPAEVVESIEARLSAATGKTVTVEATVDPSLLGGVVATVESTVYDGTVKTQLEKLRKQLVGAG